MTSKARDTLRIGLTYAGLIQRFFPAYQSAFTNRKTQATSLLGVAGLFLSLAHNHLLTLDLNAYRLTPSMNYSYGMARLPIQTKEPKRSFYHSYGDRTATSLLRYEAAAWLRAPIAKVYGLALDRLDEGQAWQARTIQSHALTLALWRMLGLTPWSPLPAERVSEIASTRCVNEALGQRIAVLPTLPEATPLPVLCAWLDAQPSLPKRLGSYLALVCRRTGNPFADTAEGEFNQEHQPIPFSWKDDVQTFAALHNDQQYAASLWRGYRQLCGRLQRDPELLESIRKALLDGSVAIAGNADCTPIYDARALHWQVAQ